MNKDDFLEQQFLSLREEIKETKSRQFKILGLAIALVPAAHFLSKSIDLEMFQVTLPFLIILVSLFYLAETNGLMRCGRYIKDCIEPEIQGIKGWETWLQEPDNKDRRIVDKYLFYCFFSLYSVYYLTAAVMALKILKTSYSLNIYSVMIGVYSAIGVWFFIFFIKNRCISTQTDCDICITKEDCSSGCK